MSNINSHHSNIEFIPAICPTCGGELRVPKDRDIVKCMYCGIGVILHDPNKIIVETRFDIETILSLAKEAEFIKNFEDAYKYYSQILEHNFENRESWLGKGISAGMLSTSHHLRIDEAEQYFIKGVLDLLKAGKSPNPIHLYLLRGYYNQISAHILDLANSHHDEYELQENLVIQAIKLRARAFSLKEVDKEWAQKNRKIFPNALIDQSDIKHLVMTLIKFLFSIHKLSCEYGTTLEYVVKMRKTLVEGLQYLFLWGFIDKRIAVQASLSDDPEIKNMLSEYVNEVAFPKKKSSWWK